MSSSRLVCTCLTEMCHMFGLHLQRELPMEAFTSSSSRGSSTSQ
jgi:hypothetical protein